MQIEINYFEKGKEKSRKVDISFVPNYIYRETQYIIEAMQDASNIHASLEQKIRDKVLITKSKTVNNEALEKINIDISNLEKKLREYEYNNFFNKRFELIKFLLVKNGIDESDEMCTFEFWDEKTLPNEIITILISVISNNKKKMNLRKNIT